jgi:hypothetical protein
MKMFAGNEELRESYQIAAFERKQEAKLALAKEAKEVMQKHSVLRKEYYEKVEKERGLKAAIALASEVNRLRRIRELER